MFVLSLCPSKVSFLRTCLISCPLALLVFPSYQTLGLLQGDTHYREVHMKRLNVVSLDLSQSNAGLGGQMLTLGCVKEFKLRHAPDFHTNQQSPWTVLLHRPNSVARALALFSVTRRHTSLVLSDLFSGNGGQLSPLRVSLLFPIQASRKRNKPQSPHHLKKGHRELNWVPLRSV